MVKLILAIDKDDWIGLKNKIPWRIKADMKFLKEVTTITYPRKINALIMWRKTLDSLWSIKLIDRRIYVITNNVRLLNSKEIGWVHYHKDIRRLILNLNDDIDVGNIFIFWWASIYKLALDLNLVDEILLTRVYWKYECDVFFDINKYLINFKKYSSTIKLTEWIHKFRFITYKK